MVFYAEIIKDKSFDPLFYIAFYYKTDKVEIPNGFVEIIRIAPKPVVRFKENVENLLDPFEKQKLELELLNKVIDYIFSNGYSITWKGSRVLRPA